MTRDTSRILIVEDDADVADMLSDHFAVILGAEVSVAESASQAMKLDLSHPHDVVLADLHLPDGDAIELVRQLRDINDPQVVLMTGDPTAAAAIEAMRLGVRDFHSKPFDLTHLTATIRQLLEDQQDAYAKERRTRRLRQLSSRIIRERRLLRKRLDLMCRDIVEAYRNLADKVVDLHHDVN